MKENQDTDRLMTVDEASSYLNMPKSGIYQLTMRRLIKFAKLGRRLRFKRSDLDDYITANLVEVGEFEN